MKTITTTVKMFEVAKVEMKSVRAARSTSEPKAASLRAVVPAPMPTSRIARTPAGMCDISSSV